MYQLLVYKHEDLYSQRRGGGLRDFVRISSYQIIARSVVVKYIFRLPQKEIENGTKMKTVLTRRRIFRQDETKSCLSIRQKAVFQEKWHSTLVL